MSMKNKLLGGAALLMAAFSLSEANATSCAVPPTCAQLGYTMKKADCGDMPIMRCPFAVSDDNQVYCEGTVKIAALPILYGDGTVSKKLLSGTNAPKPIGIVFDETNSLAIALTNLKKDGSAGFEAVRWSDSSDYDIPNLENCEDFSTVISCAVDGRANTDKILACGDSCEGTPAATVCNLYQPAGCSTNFCKKTKWFLPSIRDLNNIYRQKVEINSTLMFLSSFGAEDLSEGWHWSSVEYNGAEAFYLNMATGDSSSAYKTNRSFPVGYTQGSVRPVVKY